MLAGTSIPATSARITARSAAQLDLLAVWGSAPFDQALYSPDRRWIAAASSPGVRLYEAASLSPAGYLNSSDTITSMVFTPDSALLITGTNTGILRAWDVVQRTPVMETPIQAGAISSLAIAPTGDTAAIAYQAGLALIELETYTTSYPGSEQATTALAAAFSPAGLLLATAMGDGTIRIWGFLRL